MKVCTQATLYLVTAILGLIIGYVKTRHFVITLSALTVPVQAYVIQYLCENGYNLVAWILTLVPMVSLFFLIYFVERRPHDKPTPPKHPKYPVMPHIHPVMRPVYPVDHSGMYNKETEKRAKEQ